MTADVVRRARAAIGATFFINGLLYGSWAARIPAVRDRLGLGPGELGLALGCIAAGSLVAMPLSGWASARAGSRRATRVALTMFCAASAAVALPGGLGGLCAACFALGASAGALDVAMNAHGVEVERRAGRPVLSSLHALFSLGGLAGAATGALAAAEGADVRAHLTAAAAVCAVVGLLWTRRLLDAGADAAPRRARRAPLPAGLARRLAVLGALAFACLLCEGAAADWSALYVHRSLGASAAFAALAYAAFSITMTIGRLAGDRLTARLGAVSLVRRGGLVAAVGLATALITGDSGAALVGFACLGAGLATIIPAVFRAAGNATEQAGPALAAVSTTGYVGFLAGPPLIGAIAQAASLPVALALLPALAATLTLGAGAVAPAGEAAAGLEPVLVR